MEVFRVYLSAVNESDFKVIAQSSQGEAEADSKLPFFETADRWRTTLIKILEVNEFQPASFSPEELAWMHSTGLLTSGSDPRSGELQSRRFSTKLRVQIGAAIYNSLFPEGRVRQLLHRSIAQADQQNVQLHIQICFSSNVTEQSRLPDYPWELSYDLEDDRFLAQHQVVFSRYIAHLAAPPRLHPTQKIGILVVSSSASDPDSGLLPLTDQEQKAMLRGLEKAQTDGLIHLEFLTPATFDQLRIALTDWMPHVLHFDGHGLFGRRCNRPTCQTMHRNLKGLGEDAPCRVCGDPLPLPQGYLLFESITGQPHYVSARELGELIYKSSFVHTQKLALAVLSACKSGTALGGRSVFNGVAQSLIKHQVPAAIAMQYTIRADSATAFAEQFYRCLGHKQPLTIALSQGQSAMGTEDNQWYRPVLYLRWQDNEGGQLFDLSPSPIPTIDPSLEKEEPPLERGWLPALIARLSPGGKRDRHILLNRVKTVWIKPLDDSRSLYKKAPIPLKLERWFLEEDGTPIPSGQPLPAQQSILQTFDELGEGRRLLILGGAGAGKTTLLIELARELIRRAEANDRLPIPVMINLSSWHARHSRFSDWLLQELKTGASRYGVPKRVSFPWINQDNLLLFLDGLDEVKPEFRKACVQAINQFTQRYWRTELIICSRIVDYEALEVKLNVHAAIAVLPLTTPDLSQYFAQSRHPLATLKSAIQADPVLQELAQTPLWLTIMEQVYQGDATAERAIAPTSEDLQSRRSALWDQYLLQVLPERGATPYSRRQTAQWLSFLAQKMNQSQFQIEDIQPTWLGSQRQRQTYRLGVGLLAGLVIEWIYGVPVGLISGRVSLHMLDGLLPGLVIGIASSLRDQIRVFGALGWSWSWEQAKTVALPCLVLGPIIGVLIWLFGQVFNFEAGILPLNLLYGLVGGVAVSTVSTLLAGLGRSGITPGIVPNQGIWRSAKRSGLFTGIVVLIAAIALARFNSYSLVFSTMLPALLGCITLYVGGLALLQHSTVRKLLFWAGKAPDNYADFLNYATQRMLMNGEGGSYRFTHNLLQEYLKSDMAKPTVLLGKPRSPNPSSRPKLLFLGALILFLLGILPPLAIDSYRASPVLAQLASPRIQQDDRLLVDKLSYHFITLRRGDVISFKPTAEMQSNGFPYLQDFKQVAGLPGDHLTVRDGKIFVNCDRPTVDDCTSLNWQDSISSDFNRKTIPAIPDNTYFVISIHPGQTETTHFVGGLIPKANIRGRVWFRFYPFHQVGSI